MTLNQYTFEELSKIGRAAWKHNEWKTLKTITEQMRTRQQNNPETEFLSGLATKYLESQSNAIPFFREALKIDAERYDAAIELAAAYFSEGNHRQAFELLERYQQSLANSPIFLNMAATIYVGLGFPDRGFSLYQSANLLQPEISIFKANLAASAIFVGENALAIKLYNELLELEPGNQRHLYQLSRLSNAKDDRLARMIEALLETNSTKPSENIYAYYALAKQYEDLMEWEKAFHFFELGGKAVESTSDYSVDEDIEILEQAERNTSSAPKELPLSQARPTESSPIFIIGLPRTGTTLLEQMLAAHSQIETLGETNNIETAILQLTGNDGGRMSAEILKESLLINPKVLRSEYLDAVSFRVEGQPFFIDKMPLNFQYLNLILNAFPEARIILVHRDPLDACVAMFKQLFTWTYRFSYSLENLKLYHRAYSRLIAHWKGLFGKQIIEISYEDIVMDTTSAIEKLSAALGIPFESQTTSFNSENLTSMTASAIQVRETISTKSVGNWQNYESRLGPLLELKPD